MDFTKILTLDEYSLSNAFMSCTDLKNISFPNISSILSSTNSNSITDVVDASYKKIFEAYIRNNPDKADEYNTLLKMNNLNYRLTVLAIENIK